MTKRTFCLLEASSFLLTSQIGAQQGEQDGRIIPWFNMS